MYTAQTNYNGQTTFANLYSPNEVLQTTFANLFKEHKFLRANNFRQLVGPHFLYNVHCPNKLHKLLRTNNFRQLVGPIFLFNSMYCPNQLLRTDNFRQLVGLHFLIQCTAPTKVITNDVDNLILPAISMELAIFAFFDETPLQRHVNF